MSRITRRELVAGASVAAAGAALTPSALPAQDKGKVVQKGRVKQSVSRWCFGRIKLPELCKAGKEMGLAAIDLLHPSEFAVAHDNGLAVSTAFVERVRIRQGINDPKNHSRIIKAMEDTIPKAAKAKVRNVVTFFGDRVNGMTDGKAIENSVACLEKIKPIAEEHKVMVVIELLNSKVDHKGYIGDNTPYCVDVIKGANSDYIKVLYDIYHAQIMEGDVIRTIRKYHKWFGHYHTAGNPGRNEIDDTQELYYPAITKAVMATGYDGYYAHEFVPKKKDMLQSLRDAVKICDV